MSNNRYTVGNLDTILSLNKHNPKDFGTIESLDRIVNLFPLFDFEEYENTNYYCIYKACGANGNYFTSEKAMDRTKNILNMGAICGELDNDIVWDTVDDVIIVKGRRNLRLLAINLLMREFPGEKKTPDNEMKHVLAADDCELIRKTCLDDDWMYAEYLEETEKQVRK